MIANKKDLHRYLEQDMATYHALPCRERYLLRLIRDPFYEIWRYLVFLRREEYYYNTAKTKMGKLLYLYYLSRKNRLGNKLGFKIPHNCFGAGLTIYHHGEIIVNESARIGERCVLHGGNCIGNNGRNDGVPVIGDDLNLGIGAKVIGAVTLGNGVRVGANAVVSNSFEDGHVVLVGIPARRKG